MRRPSLHRFALALAIAATVAGAAACVREPGAPPAPATSSAPGASTVAGPTVEEARAFFATVDTDLRRLWVAASRADWVNQNFITDDTEAVSAAASEANMEYM